MRPSPAACRQCIQLLRTPSARSLPRAGTGARAFTSKSRAPRAITPLNRQHNAFQQRRHVTTTIEPEQGPHPEPFSEHASPHPLTQDPRVLLKPGNLFHPMDQSPSPSMRERAAYIKANAYCPHPDHAHTHPSHINFTCPDCGIPTYCSKEHFFSDYENHLLICDTLREVNEDDHDLRSGRFFPEFDYPGVQLHEALINFTNWDTYLYTRGFEAVNEERSLRQLTKLLTYPTTIASVLHELSPYNLRNGLTNEGLKSFAALRYTLHPPLTGAGQTIKGLRLQSPPIRLFILGARAESSLPREVWHQLAHIFPQSLFHLIFIGPESLLNHPTPTPPAPTPQNPHEALIERVSHHMKISTFAKYYNPLHDAGYFAPFDPYFDAFVCFHPGFGHPGVSDLWEGTVERLLETKVPVICTGYTEVDLVRDVDWVVGRCGGELDVLLEPQENRFRSLRWDLNDDDPTDLSQGNWGLWAFRGKRYEAVEKGGIFTA